MDYYVYIAAPSTVRNVWMDGSVRARALQLAFFEYDARGTAARFTCPISLSSLHHGCPSWIMQAVVQLTLQNADTVFLLDREIFSSRGVLHLRDFSIQTPLRANSRGYSNSHSVHFPQKSRFIPIIPVVVEIFF
jgi:hypothetical protein